MPSKPRRNRKAKRSSLRAQGISTDMSGASRNTAGQGTSLPCPHSMNHAYRFRSSSGSSVGKIFSTTMR
mgnify:CR=1 FL=1